MSERTYSHKSDGRQSSAGHSVHSAASGRANSMGIDITFGANHSNNSPYGTPALAPGLFILGSVPAIIRCWLNTNFKHDSLLYAAVCTGSYTSFLDSRLIDQLGFEAEENEDGIRKIELAVYLPEAIPHPASSRSASPAPQLPSFRVMFTVVDQNEADQKAIQIFLGSDVLRAHNADILFSTNTLTMFDDERSKLSIPLVRPENERSFKSLYIASGHPHGSGATRTVQAEVQEQEPLKEPPTQILPDTERDVAVTSSDDGASGTPASSSRPSLEHRPPPSSLHVTGEAKEAGDPNPAAPSGSSSRPGPAPAIWSNWRRESSDKQAAMDWSNATKGPPQTYQRKETGIKVLKPSKSTSRAVSSTSVPAASPGVSQSRFFDDGKRRVTAAPAPESAITQPSAVASTPQESKARPASKERQPSMSKPKSANPIGGASAFSWLNAAGQGK
jgi:ubiquitin carboxyl-terminal hydrolase 4/11